MELWVPVTIFAAFAQAIRFMLQKQLKTANLSAAGSTFARFIYSSPLIWIGALAYAQLSGQALPSTNLAFWVYTFLGGIGQIMATVFVVMLFSLRHFAVGMTFKKTEVILSVLVGMVILGEGVSGWALVAILIGTSGVLVLSKSPDLSGQGIKRYLNRASALGVGSGLMFALAGVSYRGASLSLSDGDTLLRAMLSLAWVTSLQIVLMVVWMRWREAGEITRVFRAWRIAAWVGLFSMFGSLGWFVAFTLQTVGYVTALGQIELVFSILIGAIVFREQISLREWQGIGLLSGSVLLLVLLA